MGYQMVTNDVTLPRKVILVTTNTLGAQYLENNWRYYFSNNR